MSEERWKLAAKGLAVLVRAEYPEGRSLSEIAQTWGLDTTEEQRVALAILEDEGEL